VPHSWYNIDENNNTVMAHAVILGHNIFTYTTVNVGQYTVEDIRLEMIRVLNNTGYGTWTVVYDVLTHKFSIGSPALAFSFRILSAGSLNEILGFKTPPTSFTSTVVSDSLIDVNPNRFLFLKSHKLANNINTSYVSSLIKPWIITSTVNDKLVVTTGGGTFTWTMPVLGSYTTEQLAEIIELNINIITFAGSSTWTVRLDHVTKKVTISNNETLFYVNNTDTLATYAFNWKTTDTTLLLTHAGKLINYGMHNDVIRKIRVSNTAFATEKIFDTRVYEVDTDYGVFFDIDSIDFQITDAHDRPVNLNGKGISFSLLVSSNN
jgi:hypothetical protein